MSREQQHGSGGVIAVRVDPGSRNGGGTRTYFLRGAIHLVDSADSQEKALSRLIVIVSSLS